MDCIAVSVDGGAADGAVLISNFVGLLGRLGAASKGRVEGPIGVINYKGNVVDAVAVLANVLARGMIGFHWSGEQEIRLALAHDIGSKLALARFQASISRLRKSEALAVEIRCLPRIAYPKLDVMDAF
jgi:hypothetical protein